MRVLLRFGIAATVGLLAGAAQAVPIQTWNFTTCGLSGNSGPSQISCNGAYSGTDLAGEVTVSSGIQRWTVPTTGLYTITAIGAQGGSYGDGGYIGGRGAEIGGTFTFTAGTVLQLLVGQAGYSNPGYDGYGGSGGGGSYVVSSTNTPILIAGGGGGRQYGTTQNGTDASITQYAYTGSNGAGSYTPTLKTTGAGYGGAAAAQDFAGPGGAGFYSDGVGNRSYGGSDWADGEYGGGGFANCPSGGFGGGGGGGGCGAGGGGGYSGGDGGEISGGGGSYNSASLYVVAVAGVGYGNGSIEIDEIPVPEPASLALIGAGMAAMASARPKRKPTATT